MSIKYKMVFGDIDGTLLNSQHQISAKTMQAIHHISELGIPFILVSARSPSAMTSYMKQLGSELMVCYGGSLIVDDKLNTIYSVTLSEKDLSDLAHTLKDYAHLSINHYSYEQWFSNNIENGWTKQESDITQLQPLPTPTVLPVTHKILLIGEAEEIELLESKLRVQFPHLYIHRSKATYLEIMNKQASKANAIRIIQELHQIKTEEIIAFGDNFNDLDMIEYAGLGVAMANAPVEIQKKANYVTLSNDEDGVAVVLNQLFS